MKNPARIDCRVQWIYIYLGLSSVETIDSVRWRLVHIHLPIS